MLSKLMGGCVVFSLFVLNIHEHSFLECNIRVKAKICTLTLLIATRVMMTPEKSCGV
jgi:hypothetical protein